MSCCTLIVVRKVGEQSNCHLLLTASVFMVSSCGAVASACATTTQGTHRTAPDLCRENDRQECSDMSARQSRQAQIVEQQQRTQ
jgi:hypothetical protein